MKLLERYRQGIHLINLNLLLLLLLALDDFVSACAPFPGVSSSSSFQVDSQLANVPWCLLCAVHCTARGVWAPGGPFLIPSVICLHAGNTRKKSMHLESALIEL